MFPIQQITGETLEMTGCLCCLGLCCSVVNKVNYVVVGESNKRWVISAEEIKEGLLGLNFKLSIFFFFFYFASFKIEDNL